MENIKMVLFDIDNTLVYGKQATTFYRYYSRILEQALAKALNIELSRAVKIANEHRLKYNGQGEKAFETYNIEKNVWYDELIKLNPLDYLHSLPTTSKVISGLKKKNIIIGAITDGPITQVKKIFEATSIDGSKFDFIIGWERGQAMPKYGSSAIYKNVCKKYNIYRNQAIMVGDSLSSDILPAIDAGLKAIYISEDTSSTNNKYIIIKNIESLLELKNIV